VHTFVISLKAIFLSIDDDDDDDDDDDTDVIVACCLSGV